MKIFIMDTIKLPEGSGWTTHKYEFSQNLAKLGNEAHVMLYTGTKLNEVIAHSMKTKENYKFEFIFKIIHIINILKVIHAHNFDILYTRNISFGLLALLIKRVIRSKLILELNGLVSEHKKFEKKLYGKMEMLKNLQMAILDYIEIFVAKKADAVIAVTQKIKDILIKRGIDKNKITVIPNGANVELFRPINDSVAINNLRYQYGISENAPIVMFVGNLAYWQGVEYLIQSAPLVLKTIPNTAFLIVGDGELKNELIALAKKTGMSDKFIFTGNIAYENVPLYINMANVCIVPKKILGFGYSPVKLYEYMACGKPLVATDTAGFEIVEQHNTGILVNPEDSYELSSAIVKLLQNKQLREQMGGNGRKLVVREYSWENTAKKTVEVFRKVLK